MILKGKKTIVSGVSRGIGNATDGAALAVFLALDASAFITGQVIQVDGGLSI
jgi:NAD(P)-dependent dehydrogenase (short-subunit alcohol dehydrogenase family)